MRGNDSDSGNSAEINDEESSEQFFLEGLKQRGKSKGEREKREAGNRALTGFPFPFTPSDTVWRAEENLNAAAPVTAFVPQLSVPEMVPVKVEAMLTLLPRVIDAANFTSHVSTAIPPLPLIVLPLPVKV